MADPSRLRRRAERRGQVTEYFDALVLLLKGYRVVAMRYRTKVGEVDIIARKGDLAVFVEVKARVGEREAIDAGGGTAQRRIRAASDAGVHGAAAEGLPGGREAILPDYRRSRDHCPEG